MLCELQWSHDFSVMETGHKAALFQNGALLQWSHDFSVMETRPDMHEVERVSMVLQWSHDFSVMETQAVITRYSTLLMLQWSHDFSVMETAIYTTSSKGSSAGSIQTSFGYKK